MFWGQNEGNLLGPYRVAEYALLAVWSKYHSELSSAENKKLIAKEIGRILSQLADISVAYHSKLDTHYRVQDSFARSFDNSVLVSQAVFEEIGRLGVIGYFFSHSAIVASDTFSPLPAL